MPLFPEGYGQGTTLSHQHSDFIERMNSLAAGGRFGFSSVGFATKAPSPHTILVDPVNGDDSEHNDGVETPLKTLRAASIRAPLFADATLILLSEGEHFIPIDDGSNPISYYGYGARFANAGVGMEIRGTLKTIQSGIEVDSISANRITKSALTPAWIPGEHKGRMIYFMFGYEWPPGTWIEWPGTYFIIDNTEHELFVCWSTYAMGGSDPWMEPTVIDIVEHGTKILQPTYSTRFSIGGQIWVSWLNFDGLTYGIVTQDALMRQLLIYGCKFENGVYGALLQNEGGYSRFDSCHFSNMGTAGFTLEGTGTEAGISNCFFKNCPYGVHGSFSGKIYSRNMIAAQNVTSIVRARRHASYVDACAQVWADNCTRYLIISDDSYYRKLWYDLKNHEDKKLISEVFKVLGGNNILNLGSYGDTMNLDAVGNIFDIRGTKFDWSDYRTTHGQNYKDDYRNHIYD